MVWGNSWIDKAKGPLPSPLFFSSRSRTTPGWTPFNMLMDGFTDLLGTGLSKNLVSPIARARVLGEPVDPDRAQLFESVYEELARKDYPDYPDQNKSIQSYQNFAFFESYFSNFIEGIEFTVDEAKQIITTSTPLPTPDEDSHDVLGTYQIVSNRSEMSIIPTSPDHLLQLLRERHAILLTARKTKNPGEFKDRNNRAGNTAFVDKELVPGTLKKGFDWYSLLQHPFAKAVYMMFMVSEVHPFLDGNGRIARVMMNAELSSKGLSKIIIPTVFREDYMGALKKLTKQRDADAYIRMMFRAWEFSSNIHDESLESMEKYLIACNAFLTHKEGYLRISKEPKV
jgi:Fic family protein